jgi:hypothetical protein
MSGYRHPGPVRSLDGDGEFTGSNGPLRPLAAWTATACANAFIGAGLTIGRVTCSVVTTKPGPHGKARAVRGVIRPYERHAVSFVLEIDGWPKGQDVFGASDQPYIETKLQRMLEAQGMPQREG